MVGQNRVNLARKAFSKYNGEIFGVETLKNIVRINLSSNENTVVNYLMVMREVGILEEVEPFRFLINVEADNPIKEKDGKL